MKKSVIISLAAIAVIIVVGFFVINHLSRSASSQSGSGVDLELIIAQYEAVIAEMQQTISRLETDNAEMQSSIIALSSGGSDQVRILNEREQRITLLTTENRTLDQRIRERDTRISTLENERTNLSSQVTVLRSENTSLERRVTDLNEQIRQIRQALLGE